MTGCARNNSSNRNAPEATQKRLSDLPIRLLKNKEEVFAFAPLHFRFGEEFGFGAVRFSRCQARRSGWRIGHWQVEVQRAAARNDNGSFDHVPQLPNVAGLVVTLQF